MMCVSWGSNVKPSLCQDFSPSYNQRNIQSSIFSFIKTPDFLQWHPSRYLQGNKLTAQKSMYHQVRRMYYEDELCSRRHILFLLSIEQTLLLQFTGQTPKARPPAISVHSLLYIWTHTRRCSTAHDEDARTSTCCFSRHPSKHTGNASFTGV